ncbi:MAG: hypothetical protein WDA26_10400 [Pusillimonas sp.]
MIPVKYKFIREVGKGKSGISSLVVCDGVEYIYKEMHSETVSYYHFSGPKINLEIDAYKILEKQNINIPKLIESNTEQGYLIKEYIDGLTVSEAISAGVEIDSYIKEVLIWEKSLQANNINIDYFPSNFVIKNNSIYYVDYELNPYSEEWNFTNWGIYYWLNGDGFKNFLQTNDSTFINLKDTGIPIKTPTIEAKRTKCLSMN